MNDNHFQIGWKPQINISLIVCIKGKKLGGFFKSPTEITCKTEDRWQADKNITGYFQGEWSLESL